MNVFMNRYNEWLGKDFDGLENVEELPVSIRVNTLKIKERDLIRRLEKKGVKLEKVKFAKFGYKILKSDFSLGAANEFLQGYYYIQEAASQYPVQLLDPQPGEVVLDMAAAPGGKTTQIAQWMKNIGVVVALDLKTKRLEALRNNCSRLGAENILIYNKDARYVEDLDMKFDRVLLDAPCSGNFVTEKDWFAKRKISDFAEMAKLQKQLLMAGLNVLKKNGVLVYSTCSLEREEDEEIIEWLKEGTKLKVLEQKKFWPHIDATQGFFVCMVKKL
ncbi:RsmB/NOP family class I SAM-dependent RNA methyltransferase [Candidatus Woesearchaeota archaeon]|nr:RsmB/NOP family class I SAM-dependent RNA methyltransferase [Candidatus Woesearchaeota archaeon]